MSKQVFSFFTRRAIWEAHNKRCGHCLQPVSFAGLEIDHIVPESLQNAEESKWDQICKTHGLPKGFDFQDLENLIPSCRTCNSRKGDSVLAPGITSIQRTVAKREKSAIEELILKFKEDDRKDKLRFSIAAAIESGALAPQDLPQFVSSVQAKDGKFKLTAPNLFGENPVMELSQKKYEEYLDTVLALPDWSKDGLRLVNDVDKEVRVHTLRQYQEAIAQGFYALANVEMKTAYSLFERPLGILRTLLKARLAETSHIDNPRRGLADIELLPATLLFRFDPSLFVNPDARQVNPNATVKSLVDRGEATIVDVGTDRLAVHFQECRTFLFELMRADIDGDDCQDLLIHWGGGPLQGTLSVGAVKVLSRRSEDAVFSVSDA